ncbi:MULTISPECIES: hypothetical protein [Pseudomonas]|nr:MULTISPECIES: hypothetical protein [Pseudomonas]
MAVVAALAVLREGSEVVLFLYGIAASTQTSLFMCLIRLWIFSAGVQLSRC